MSESAVLLLNLHDILFSIVIQSYYITDLYNIPGLQVLLSNHLKWVFAKRLRQQRSLWCIPLIHRKRAITECYLGRRLVCESLLALGHYLYRLISFTLSFWLWFFATTYKRTWVVYIMGIPAHFFREFQHIFHGVSPPVRF